MKNFDDKYKNNQSNNFLKINLCKYKSNMKNFNVGLLTKNRHNSKKILFSKINSSDSFPGIILPDKTFLTVERESVYCGNFNTA